MWRLFTKKITEIFSRGCGRILPEVRAAVGCSACLLEYLQKRSNVLQIVSAVQYYTRVSKYCTGEVQDSPCLLYCMNGILISTKNYFRDRIFDRFKLPPDIVQEQMLHRRNETLELHSKKLLTVVIVVRPVWAIQSPYCVTGRECFIFCVFFYYLYIETSLQNHHDPFVF